MRHCSKAYIYVYVHTSAVRVNDLTRPRISKKQKGKRICRTIKVNILVVRMIFDTRNGGWSLDQNVIIYPYTFSFYIEMYCFNRSITFFYYIIYTRRSFFIWFESMSRRSSCRRMVLCRRLIEEFLFFFE